MNLTKVESICGQALKLPLRFRKENLLEKGGEVIGIRGIDD